MNIYGLDKLTLLDYPDKTACIIFTPCCDVRCVFCHNAQLARSKKTVSNVSEDDFFEFLKTRVGLLNGVVITGGEPTLQDDIIPFIKKIKDLGFLVKLDTNGLHPDRLKDIIDSGYVDYIAMDIKNCLELYSLTAGCVVDTKRIEDSIKLIMDSGIDYEFRTTISPSYISPENIEKLADMVAGCKAYYLQKYVDSEHTICKCIEPDDEYVNKCLEVAYKYIPNTFVRG